MIELPWILKFIIGLIVFPFFLLLIVFAFAQTLGAFADIFSAGTDYKNGPED